MGSLAIGPALWGGLAQATTIPTAIYTASICLMIAAFFTRRWPVSGNEKLDHDPSRHWQQPEPVVEILPHQGPVMICIRYQVQADTRQEFLLAMEQLGKARRRDGASDWHVMEDIRTPGVFQEFYRVDTWLDHLRQHERISKQDAAVQAAIREFLVAGTAPEISHFVRAR